MIKKLSFEQISPMLRYAHTVNSENEKMMNTEFEYRAYDTRLIYVLDGKLDMEIEGTHITLHSGGALYWHSGLRYRYAAGQKSNLLAFNFDLTNSSKDHRILIVPDKSSQFQPEQLTEQVELSDLTAFNSVVTVEDFSGFYPELKRLFELHTMKMRYYAEKCSGILKYLLAELGDKALVQTDVGTPEKIAKVIQYIQAHYNKPLSNGQLGQLFNYHPYYLNRLMLRYTGITLHRYLIQYRI